MKLKPEQSQELKAMMPQLPIFRGCSEQDLDSLLAVFESLIMPKDKVVLMDQEISKRLFILTKGSVGIWRRLPGGEKDRLATLLAPNVFGEVSMFMDSAATAQVKTEEACQMYVLDKVEFDRLGKRFPELKQRMERNAEVIRDARAATADLP